MSTVIKVENLSKQYRLGDVGTGTLRDDFKRWAHRVMGKEDPFLKVGEVNDRSTKGESDYVWALKDINFEIQQGDVVGIIGRNGAGKSTLLKILSRTTAPTTGSVKVRGRIASLLEVGTGFHGELSGRENIYLNGAIMGLRKWEIDKKLDEIIDFAGVDRYLDTPVKRYSSGMYVRLAFAVAAHLEPDILIVDEVLAVGDAEFQKKCLGKMKDVSKGQGRTVLFVSHNIDAVETLCKSSMILENGKINYFGSTLVGIKKYLFTQNDALDLKVESSEMKFVEVKSESIFESNENIEFDIKFKIYSPIKNLFVDCAIVNEKGIKVIHIKSDTIIKPTSISIGEFLIKYVIEKPNLVPGYYRLIIYAYNEFGVYLWVENINAFKISSKAFFGNNFFIKDNKGIVLPNVKIRIL